jgi:ubiquinone/menaquinone biosynthesis C-methylase UbiE
METLEDVDRSQKVQDMFSQIAPYYDRMNRIMTFGRTCTGGNLLSVMLLFRQEDGFWISDQGQAIS